VLTIENVIILTPQINKLKPCLKIREESEVITSSRGRW